MDFIKKNKKVIQWGSIIVVILLTLLLIKIFIFPTMGKNLYGNRLDGMDAVRINSDSVTKLKTDLKATEQVEDATYHLEGKIINFVINMKPDVKVEDAKNIANKVLDGFTKSQKEYYDIQVILTQTGNKESGFPYFGYKNKTREGFVWSNN